ncbi:MAG TPA: hypothetical protein VMP68_12560 [Candidatus Eisenbacteria bacterium]|nr:hypothetical protein [Candidatus Eisenbacteria bacterium]
MRKRIVYWLAVIGVVLVLGFAGELFRGIIASSVWHLRHGGSIVAGDYEIALPRYWFVESTNGSVTQLARAHFPHTNETSFQSSATVSTLAKPVSDLQLWESEEQRFYAKEGGTILRTLEVRLTPEQRIVCVEGELAREVLRIPSPHLVSANCQANSRLNLMFTGTEGDFQEFYSIVERLRIAH